MLFDVKWNFSAFNFLFSFVPLLFCCICLVFHFCWVFLRDYDSPGAMMNGYINKAGAIQGHAGHNKDLCFFLYFCNFLYQWNILFIKCGSLKDTEVNWTTLNGFLLNFLDFDVQYVTFISSKPPTRHTAHQRSIL